MRSTPGVPESAEGLAADACRRFILRHAVRALQGRSAAQRLTLWAGGGVVFLYYVGLLIEGALRAHAVLAAHRVVVCAVAAGLNVAVAQGPARRLAAYALSVPRQAWMVVLPLDQGRMCDLASRAAWRASLWLMAGIGVVEGAMLLAGRVPAWAGVMCAGCAGLLAGAGWGHRAARRQDGAAVGPGRSDSVRRALLRGPLASGVPAGHAAGALCVAVLGAVIAVAHEGPDRVAFAGGLALVTAHLAFIGTLRSAALFQPAVRVLPFGFARAVWLMSRPAWLLSAVVFALPVCGAVAEGASALSLAGYGATAAVLDAVYLGVCVRYFGNDRLAGLCYAVLAGIAAYDWALMGPLVPFAAVAVACVAWRQGRARFLMGDRA